MLAGCTVGGGTGLDLPLFDVVYECDIGGHHTVEYCWPDGPKTLAADLGDDVSCHPTPRHIGVCLYSCPSPESGCNAYNGCWCP